MLSSTDALYKLCSAGADYKITKEQRKNDEVEKLEDGEEVGQSLVEGNVWHTSTFPIPWA